MSKNIEIETLLTQTMKQFDFDGSTKLVGEVISVYDGIAVIVGLETIKYEELVLFPRSGLKGIVLAIEEFQVLVTILGDYEKIKSGDEVEAQNKYFSIKVDDSIVGRCVNGYGEPIDEEGDLTGEEMEIEKEAVPMLDRSAVNEQLITGYKSIDWLIPVGFGQRQLILGDKGTGKTTMAIDIMLSLANNPDVVSIYVSIGQRINNVPKILEVLRNRNVTNFVIVVANYSDPSSMRYLAPFTGTTIGEYFRDNKKKAVIFYDDLSAHAVSYREMSLIMKRPPGREAYPGDIFYLHSRLLERSSKLCRKLGFGSLTAFPIVETVGNDISGYIPTNVISITDGQIFFNELLLLENIRPAIQIGTSVSRVGGDAYLNVIKSLAKDLKPRLVKYEEAKVLTKMASSVGDDIKQILLEGEVLMNILGQTQYQPVPLWKQIILLYAIHHRYIRVMNDVTILMNRINEFSHSADLIIKNNTATLQMLMEMVYGTNAKN